MIKSSRIFFLILSGLFLLAGILLCLPVTQNLLLIIGGKILGRSLNAVDFWIDFMVRFAILFFLFSILTVWLNIRTTKEYQIWYESRKNKVNITISIAFVIICFILFFLPFIIFGENSVITIHDNLDDSIPRFHYLHQNNLFWTFSKEIPVMNGTSTLFFNREGYTVYNAIYCLLPTYAGYIINHVLCFGLGFFSMFFLQKYLFKHENIIILTLTSLAYSLLPSICVYKMAVATMPFAVILFYKLLTTKEKRWFVMAFFYPFFAELSAIGLFACGFWLLSIIIFCIKNKRIEWSLIIGLILICIGFGITNSRLIYMRFVIHEPLNRDFMDVAPVSFIRSFITFFFNGYYHSATLQKYLVDWVILGVIISIFVKHSNTKEQNTKTIKIILIVCITISFFCSLIAALSDAKIIDKIIAVIIPPLTGVSFTRIYTISRVACYIAFTASLLYIADRKKILALSYTLGILQIFIIFTTEAIYNDSYNTWKKKLSGSTNITWKEFYSEKQFSQIKHAINYRGEPVCAVGYHPGILLYNDFNTIDGYLSVYPYRQQTLWHDLMIPEFEQNEAEMKYFDSWGGRRYIYNKDLPYAPTTEKYHEPIALHIDMNILKNNYHCKYILSRAELSNAEELGLKSKGTFDLPDSIYIIWVYEVTD